MLSVGVVLVMTDMSSTRTRARQQDILRDLQRGNSVRKGLLCKSSGVRSCDLVM